MPDPPGTLEAHARVRSLPIFESLDDGEVAILAEGCEARRFAAEETILDDGDRGPGLFVIDAGRAHVLKAFGAKHKVVGELHAGDHFGEMSLLTDAPTSASVRADSDLECFFIPRERFLALLEEHPALGRKVLWAFLQTLSSRLAEVDKRYARALHRRDRWAAFAHLGSLTWLHLRLVLSYAWVWVRKKVLRWPHAPAALARIHRKSAARFRETAFRLKGANIKAGQLASMQVHLLPKDIIEELRSLRDKVPASEYGLIAGQIQSELGLSPLELFAEFDKVPIAAASMGQVHVARLKTGEKVVVKVLHPGLEESVAIDLWMLRRLIGGLSMIVRRYDLRAMYREAEQPLMKELDLLHEGHATEEVARELASIGVEVPKVYWRYSSRRVLTLGFIEGVSLDDLEQIAAWGVDREALMRTYFRSFMKQAFEGGFFHCDPHPGNVFCTPDGRLAMLDFGMVKRLPDHVRDGMLKEILGGFFNNPRMYCDGLIQKGMIGEADRAEVERWATEIFADPAMRAMLFDHDVAKDGDMKELFGAVDKMIKGLATFRMPQDNLMLLRAIGIVIDVCKQVVPELPPNRIATPVIAEIFAGVVARHPEYLALAAPPPSEEEERARAERRAKRRAERTAKKAGAAKSERETDDTAGPAT